MIEKRSSIKSCFNWTKRKLNEIKCGRWKHVKEYCENSSIHGFRYFTNRNIHLIERVWWLISVLCSFVACCFLITVSYQKWNDNPLIVTFSEKMIPIKDIPFPAVTICPETKTRKFIFDYTESEIKLFRNIKRNGAQPPYYGISEEKFKILLALFQICASDVLQEFENFGANFTDENILHLFRKIGPHPLLLMDSCKFGTIDKICTKIFNTVITDDGLCYTFNSLTYHEMFINGSNEKMISDKNVASDMLSNWTLEDGYGNDDMSTYDELYPFRGYGAGSKLGLNMQLYITVKDIDYRCRGEFQSFKIMLHNPNELPQSTVDFFRIPIGEETRVSIKPNMLITSNSLKSYSPHRRQCYFNSERKLRFLKAYTQRNCELECLANFTIATCGCVKFSMPRDKNTLICGTSKIKCYEKADSMFLKGEIAIKNESCDCLPACTTLAYDTEISQSTYEFQNALAGRMSINFNHTTVYDAVSNIAALSIFFKENQFITSKRSELIGLPDFVSACGGLLGLFMGVSLLSIVEFLYYFSLRLFCSIRLRRERKIDNSFNA